MKLKALAAALICASPIAAVSAQDAPAAAPTKVAPAIQGAWKAQNPGPLLTIEGKEPPLKPAARKAWLARRKAMLAGDPKVDLSKRCKPPGEPRLMASGTPFEFVMSPGRILIAYEWNRLVRMIEMGEPREVIGPVYFGQNAGKWEGDTLVVDTQALHENAWLDSTGLPHGENARLTERFRLLSPATLEATIKVVDPEMYTRPWTARLLFTRLPGYRIKEDVCLEREGLVGKL